MACDIYYLNPLLLLCLVLRLRQEESLTLMDSGLGWKPPEGVLLQENKSTLGRCDVEAVSTFTCTLIFHLLFRIGRMEFDAGRIRSCLGLETASLSTLQHLLIQRISFIIIIFFRLILKTWQIKTFFPGAKKQKQKKNGDSFLIY